MKVSHVKPAFRFELAISFAGPHRDKVRAIAERLSEVIDPGIKDRSKGRVFFDEWFRHEILGSDMDVLLQNFYHTQSFMVVADLSQEYADRPWTQAEARAIRALRMRLDTARDETARLRLLNVRFDPGEVPGVLNTEGWLDCTDLSAEEVADVILKRREVLQERLGIRENSTDEPPVSSPKGWVWHSTLATRAAGQVSVLAVVETLLAIALYWWIAIRFETHWHLVSSVFIAPLLLLRSPESMATGVRWFLKDWFGLVDYKNWSRGKRVCWIVVLGLVTGALTYCFASELSHRWLTGLQGWPHFGRATAVGALSSAGVLAIVFAIMLGDPRTSVDEDALLASVAPCVVMVALMSAGTIVVPIVVAGDGEVRNALEGAVTGALGVIPGALTGFLTTFSACFALRALVFRLLATLLNLPAGVCRLPANWKENNLLTDSTLPTELMPGIRDHIPMFSWDGFPKRRSGEPVLLRVYMRLVLNAMFLPAFLYRLNIKATAWFWWPLAYLLKPATAASAEGAQRQALCWPWSNPAQRWWIFLSIGLALLSLALYWLVVTSHIESGIVTTIPLSVRVLSGLGWARLGPWHWALWIIAATGAGMLLLAGNAYSHDMNRNWTKYRERWPQNIRWMTTLRRVRMLSTIALLVMSLGALLLQDRTWQAHFPVPASWMTALEDFYQLPR